MYTLWNLCKETNRWVFESADTPLAVVVKMAKVLVEEAGQLLGKHGGMSGLRRNGLGGLRLRELGLNSIQIGQVRAIRGRRVWGG